jgi:hypothetical protein
LLDKAAQWIIVSGSQEHLCLLHLGKARVALAAHEVAPAEAALREGLRTAQHSGFGLYHIDMVVEEATLALLAGDPRRAADRATAALHGVLPTGAAADRPDLPADRLLMPGAAHPACTYAWGRARAGQVLAEARWLLGEQAAARQELVATVALQRRLADPALPRSEELLQTMGVDS